MVNTDFRLFAGVQPHLESLCRLHIRLFILLCAAAAPRAIKKEPWGSWVNAKNGDPAKVTDEIMKAKRKGPVTVFFSSATDPYQPLEATAKVTRALLEAMAAEPPDFVLLQTRSPLVVRDIDVLQHLKSKVRVSMTVETDRDDVRRIVTPSAPPIAGRLKALRDLKASGVDTQAAVSPILPHSTSFPELLAEVVPRVVVDDYFRGDGSKGRRSELLGMRQLYGSQSWMEWYNPTQMDRLVHNLQTHFPPEAIGISAGGFAPPKL
ncbi:SPL family radical SAM protein [Cohnella kolymensis]|uniref:SPL family radical SAM protein n=1 Tax=Cohnella kolymensis TaxID=1590652 RepID=UPI000A6CC2EA